MSRILLADDSPHAQRMGELILRGEGFEVVTVTDGQTALIRLSDVNPDLVVADVCLPQKSGYEICQHIKNHPQHRHARVVLTAGALEELDEEYARRVGADAVLKKPFEASVTVETVKPLLEAAKAEREMIEVQALENSNGQADEQLAESVPPITTPAAATPVSQDADPEQVRAAVTVALDAALPAMIDEITERVLVALGR